MKQHTLYFKSGNGVGEVYWRSKGHRESRRRLKRCAAPAACAEPERTGKPMRRVTSLRALAYLTAMTSFGNTTYAKL